MLEDRRGEPLRLVVTAGTTSGTAHRWDFVKERALELSRSGFCVSPLSTESYQDVNQEYVYDLDEGSDYDALKKQAISLQDVDKSERSLFFITHGSYLRVNFGNISSILVGLLNQIGGVGEITLISCNAGRCDYEHDAAHDDREQEKLVDGVEGVEDIRFDAGSFLALEFARNGGSRLCNVIRTYEKGVALLESERGVMCAVTEREGGEFFGTHTYADLRHIEVASMLDDRRREDEEEDCCGCCKLQ